MTLVLLIITFFLALSALLYELIAGTLAGYLIGSYTTAFSLTIGFFLAGMGVGAYVSQYLKKHLITIFILLELSVALTGGFVPLLSFAFFVYLPEYFQSFFWCALFLLGIGVGAEIPLLIRLVKKYQTFTKAVANVLGLDYLGALAASWLFPFVLLPQIGLYESAVAAAMVNAAVAALSLYLFKNQINKAFHNKIILTLVLTFILLTALGFLTPWSVQRMEKELYTDDIIYAKQTPYQRIVVTRWRDDIRLFLDGNLQFSTMDEYRYHEVLVHPAFLWVPWARRVLILGGGDGFAAREALKYPQVETITLIDLDPEITELFKEHPLFAKINNYALQNPKVQIINQDAMLYLKTYEGEAYDIIIADLPDPNTEILAKLYSDAFFQWAAKCLAPKGVFITQGGSPFFTRKSFWCIVQTLRTVFNEVKPFYVYVPSFGLWGFVAAAQRPLPTQNLHLQVKTRYLNDQVLPGLFNFPEDTKEIEAPVNRFSEPIIHTIYNEEAAKLY